MVAKAVHLGRNVRYVLAWHLQVFAMCCGWRKRAFWSVGKFCGPKVWDTEVQLTLAGVIAACLHAGWHGQHHHLFISGKEDDRWWDTMPIQIETLYMKTRQSDSTLSVCSFSFCCLVQSASLDRVVVQANIVSVITVCKMVKTAHLFACHPEKQTLTHSFTHSLSADWRSAPDVDLYLDVSSASKL